MLRKAAAREPLFFVDRSLGGKLVIDALRAVGAQVVGHDEVFAQNATDVEWLEEAGRRRWTVPTKDGNIRRNPHEKAMFLEAGVRVFALARKDLPGQEMAALFTAALPGMCQRVNQIEPPFVFSISRGGEFKRLD